MGGLSKKTWTPICQFGASLEVKTYAVPLKDISPIVLKSQIGTEQPD